MKRLWDKLSLKVASWIVGKFLNSKRVNVRHNARHYFFVKYGTYIPDEHVDVKFHLKDKDDTA